MIVIISGHVDGHHMPVPPDLRYNEQQLAFRVMKNLQYSSTILYNLNYLKYLCYRSRIYHSIVQTCPYGWLVRMTTLKRSIRLGPNLQVPHIFVKLRSSSKVGNINHSLPLLLPQKKNGKN